MKNREIEVKVLDIDLKKTILKLKSLGAKKICEYFYKRIIFDFTDNSLDKKESWIRLRTDKKTSTLTYKKRHNNTITGKEECEIIVDDFEKTRSLLKCMGLEEKRFQESRRIRYSLDNVEIDIDMWPLIPPHMEVEAKTKKELLNTLRKLEIKLKDTNTFGGRELYNYYNLDLDRYKNLKLEKEKKVMKI